MLTTLKATMRNEVEYKGALESAMDTLYENIDDVKSVFLDDPDAMVIGAENDPEIAKLVDAIPDDINDETAEVTEKDIEEITENYIPESMIGVTESISDSAEDGDSGDDEDIDLDDLETPAIEEDIEAIYVDGDIDDGLNEAFDNILGEDQKDHLEDNDDESIKTEPESDHFDNIDGKDQKDDLNDNDTDETIKTEPESDHFDNIDGEKQDDIEDADDSDPVKESYIDTELIEDFGLEFDI